MLTQHVKAVLFDKDGTLLNFAELWGTWLTAVGTEFQSYLMEMGAADNCGPFCDFGLGVWYDAQGKPTGYSHLGPMSAGTMEQVETILAWHLWNRGTPWHDAIAVTKQSIARVEKAFDTARPISPLPGLHSYIRRLRDNGIALAVVTSDNTSSAIRHLEWLQLMDAFDIVIGRDSVALGKPEPDMVYTACRHLGVLPGEVALIGDSEVDMEMGHRAEVRLRIHIVPGAVPDVNPRSSRWTIRDYNDLPTDFTTMIPTGLQLLSRVRRTDICE